MWETLKQNWLLVYVAVSLLAIAAMVCFSEIGKKSDREIQRIAQERADKEAGK